MPAAAVDTENTWQYFDMRFFAIPRDAGSPRNALSHLD